MRRTKKKRLPRTTTQSGGPAPSALHSLESSKGWWQFQKKSGQSSATKLKDRDLAFILRNLATLTENGVSLPKALGTLAEEKSLEMHREMLHALRCSLENGESFSVALSQFGSTFDPIMVNQVKVGERSGTLPDTLSSIALHCEEANELRGEILKQLAYPIILIVMGGGVITFLLMYVVPVFQETYDSAGVALPMITQVLIAVGDYSKNYGWMVLGLVGASVLTVRQLRKKSEFATKMDEAMLNLPIFGPWLRDIAVLQLMEVLGNLMEAGFNLAEALGESAQAIGNRAVQQGVRNLELAVRQGEKFSREIERQGELFPPIVSQLIIVGEQTGKLTRATSHIRKHLKQEIKRKTNLMVGTLEPVLTISLAAAIAVILLAIYLPMFDMISAVSG